VRLACAGRNFPVCDGFFHVDVGVHGAFGFEVTTWVKPFSRAMRALRAPRSSAVRNGILQKLLVIVLPR